MFRVTKAICETEPHMRRRSNRSIQTEQQLGCIACAATLSFKNYRGKRAGGFIKWTFTQQTHHLTNLYTKIPNQASSTNGILSWFRLLISIEIVIAYIHTYIIHIQNMNSYDKREEMWMPFKIKKKINRCGHHTTFTFSLIWNHRDTPNLVHPLTLFQTNYNLYTTNNS